MARKRIQRRQPHGSAWHWKQTDCWYYTEPGTKKRVPLFDEKGDRIRGKENKETARLALARIQLSEELNLHSPTPSDDWTVAKVCDIYLDDLHRSANPDWAKQVQRWLNDFCSYCGALAISELKKKHLRNWVQRHTTWNHNTQRNVIASVKAAFNYCCKYDDLDSNPLASYEKPTATPRVTAFSPEEEKTLYENTNAAFGLFLKACILTGARPYSELAKVTADHVVETPQGMYYLLKARTGEGRHGHKTAKKTGKDRRIMLCDEMETITRQLMLTAPRGSGKPLFRSTRAKAWKRCNCVQHFRLLKQKLKLSQDKCTYTCRHTFAKRTLSGYYTGKPVTIEVLAGLMGNTPKVCWDHYAAWADQYNDPLWEALGKKKPKREAC
jgi:site-specific recombinase XerD